MSYKMAIIGYGGMGEWHHRTVSENIKDIVVKATYDIREEALKDAEKAGLKVYNDFEDLLNDKDIELVVITTPNDVHKNYAIKCLRAGKNVICEKPVTLNAQELKEIMSVAEQTGKFFTVHQNRRWDLDYLTIKHILSEGLLSKPYFIESRVQGSRRVLHGWRGYKVNGGGMVLDWGVHLLDQLLLLFDEPVVSVNSYLHSIFTDQVDDNFTATIKFQSGVTALINVAMNCFIPQPRWHMCCEDGTAVIESWSMDGKIVKLADERELDWGEVILYTESGPTRSMRPRPKETTEEIELPKVKRDALGFYKNIVAVLDGKDDLIVTAEQALRVMEVVDKIFESYEKGVSLTCLI